LLYSKTKMAALMTSFSPLRSLNGLISPQKTHWQPEKIQGEETLRTLDGLKMMSMIWLIYGGSYLFASYFVIANPQDIDFYYNQYFFTIITSSYLGIDVFLLLSGLINTHMFLSMNQISVKTILKSYLIRSSKFFIVIASVMFTAYVALGRLIQGPVANLYFDEFKGCSQYWYTNLFFFSNFYPGDYNMKCMWWSWYFAVDF